MRGARGLPLGSGELAHKATFRGLTVRTLLPAPRMQTAAGAGTRGGTAWGGSGATSERRGSPQRRPMPTNAFKCFSLHLAFCDSHSPPPVFPCAADSPDAFQGLRRPNLFSVARFSEPSPVCLAGCFRSAPRFLRPPPTALPLPLHPLHCIFELQRLAHPPECSVQLQLFNQLLALTPLSSFARQADMPPICTPGFIALAPMLRTGIAVCFQSSADWPGSEHCKHVREMQRATTGSAPLPCLLLQLLLEGRKQLAILVVVLPCPHQPRLAPAARLQAADLPFRVRDSGGSIGSRTVPALRCARRWGARPAAWPAESQKSDQTELHLLQPPCCRLAATQTGPRRWTERLQATLGSILGRSSSPRCGAPPGLPPAGRCPKCCHHGTAATA